MEQNDDVHVNLSKIQRNWNKKIDEFPYEENYQNLKSIKLMNKEGTEGILNLSIIDI